VKHPAVISLFLLAATLSWAQTYTIESVPNVKLVNNSYVSNPDNIISAVTASQIDSVLSDLEKSATAQVAVVLLNSIGDEDHVDFAQRLFEKWGIGQASNDNGLLILLVKDQRTVRFHTGNGIEGILPDAICKRIQREYMVPYFKDGDYDTGILEGTIAAANVLNDPESLADVQTQDATGEDIALYNLTVWIIVAWIVIGLISFFAKRKSKSFAEFADDNTIPKAQFTSGFWFFWFIVVAVIVMILLTMTDSAVLFFGGLYAYSGATAVLRRVKMDKYADRWIAKKDYQRLYNYYRDKQSVFSFMRFLFPIPFAFLYGTYKRKISFFRDHPRECKECGKALIKLDENKDDNYLSKGQIREEQLKSIDYDVWECTGCYNTETLIYPNPDSKYTACPKCNFKTQYKVSSRTVRAATESSTGVGEETRLCKFCNHQVVSKYTIAKIVRSSSSSSSGSSSSGGGSWGGGSSGGGGASSSW
jgi:uncharacterized protein